MALLSLLHRAVGRPLFLPAHGRGEALPPAMRRLLRRPAGLWDLPELPALGGPLESGGAVADSQRSAADAMGVSRCWYGVNGATGLLQAALLGITRPGEAVLMPRNAHRSLIQACLLGQLTPLLFDLPYRPDRGHPAPPDEAWLETVLAALPAEHPPISAAVLVHPTYQGYGLNPAPLIQRLQQRGWPVLVDRPTAAISPQMWIQSCPRVRCEEGPIWWCIPLKSATGLAQTAVLWQQGERIDTDALERSLGGCRPPASALLLASSEAALMHWRSRGGRRLLQRRLKQARTLRDQLRRDGLPLLNTEDPLRLVLHTGRVGISGLDADDWLLPRGLVAELPEPATLTFCLGLADQRDLRRPLRRARQRLLAIPTAHRSHPLLHPRYRW